MVIESIVAANARGDVVICACGGVRLRMAGAMLHVAKSDVAHFRQLSQAAAQFLQAPQGLCAEPRHQTAPTPSYQTLAFDAAAAAKAACSKACRHRLVDACNRTLH